ncbi:MAG: hypothetical protein IKP15_04375 [Bacteroidales bacterium]|nr:hypothetical protein [Bacteroidales bacterium]
MKKYHIIQLVLTVCGLLAVSCSKTAVDGPETNKEGEVLLSVRFDAPGTKVGAQSVTNEKAIQNVQIFVFRAGNGGDAGNLEIAASSGFDTPLNNTDGSYSGMMVKCSTGQREVWAVVNDSADRTAGPDAVTTKSEFLALTHELKYASATKLLMIGHSGTELEPAVTLHEGREDVSIVVHRLAAAVILESVKNDFSSPAYQKADMFRLENCYLINVPGRINFGETSEPSALPTEQWYARLAAETASPKADLLYDALAGQIVNYGASYTVPHTFYTYPNNCAVSEDASWCARATLLVLEASIKYPSGWVKYYYPVQLGAGPLLSNKQYRVNLTIHRPGSLDPNHPVTFDDVTPVISVTDWESGDRYDREI